MALAGHHQTTAVTVHLQPHRASLVPPDPADSIRHAQLPGSTTHPDPSQIRSNNARRIDNGLPIATSTRSRLG